MMNKKVSKKRIKCKKKGKTHKALLTIKQLRREIGSTVGPSFSEGFKMKIIKF